MFIGKIYNTFYLFYRDESGTRKKITTKTKSKSEALKFLRDFKEKEHTKKTSTPLCDFADEYIKYAAGAVTPKTLHTYKSSMREALRIFGNVPIQSIGVKEIEFFLNAKKMKSSVWSARRDLVSLSAAFSKACDWGLMTENPFRKVKKPRMPETLPTYLNQQDFQKLFSSIGEPFFRDFCYIGILTGMRLGELLHLPWSSVNFDDKCIIVQNNECFITKSKRSRIIPMNQELYSLLWERKMNVTSESGWVFHDSKGNPYKENLISKKFKHYVKLSGVNAKIHFHSLRHSFASALVKEGISLYVVQKLLGHRSIKTTEIYCHLSPDQLHREVETGLKSFKFGL